MLRHSLPSLSSNDFDRFHPFRDLASSPSLAGPFDYTARARYVGRIVCNQMMSKDDVKFFLLNGTKSTYFEADHSTHENTSNDPWIKSKETRAARCDKDEVSFCPPIAAVNIQGVCSIIAWLLSPRTHLLCRMCTMGHKCTWFRDIAAIWC